MTKLNEFDLFLESNLEISIKQLETLVAQPSISATRKGLFECSEMVVQIMKKRRFRIQIFTNQIAPIIFAERKGKRNKTILFYNHYDVQPPEPLDLWESSPFEPVIREGKLFGRGSNDDKGNIVNRLFALDAFLALEKELPCNVKFLIEGQEEVSSVDLEKFVHDHGDLLEADACIWESGGVDQNNTPIEYLGLRGICYVQLDVETANQDTHSGLGGSIFPNAAWRLIWALRSIKGQDERIRLPGFYDKVRPPSSRDRELMAKLVDSADEYKRRYGISHFINGLEGGVNLRIAEVFQPTCTICGLTSGYQGPGSKTVLPAKASAKIDFRLVPDQDPQDVLKQLRTHLDSNGFDDISITDLGSEKPARTDPDDPFIQILVNTAKEVYGKPMQLMPLSGGSGPNYLIQDALKIPIASFGIGYPDANAHAPNENIRLIDYLNAAKHLIRILSAFSES
jgi:acetylornithine deacetylase/succinyl-diaminopimelate desuccinylase-like protein